MKKAIILSALLAGSTALGAGLVAMAQDGTRPDHGPHMNGYHDDRDHGMMQSKLENLDTNKDGNISKEEAQAAKIATFAEIDSNKDGQISQTEMVAYHEAKREEMRRKMETERFNEIREKLDTNKDGKISQEEFVNEDMPMFDRIDSNNDGLISASERAAVKERMEKRSEKIRKWKERNTRNAETR